jgi:glycosyltransferase involved in cell wall biosynthesis
VAELAGDLPDLQLVIAGAHGWGEAALEAAIAATGSGSRVVRLGYVSDEERAELVTGAVLLAYPSVYEGFGLPPLEAMAAGTPVVATAGGSIAEVVGDGAEIVPVGDAAAMATAMLRVIQDAEHRRDLVARGRVRASQFTWQATADQMIAVYREARDDRR